MNVLDSEEVSEQPMDSFSDLDHGVTSGSTDSR